MFSGSRELRILVAAQVALVLATLPLASCREQTALPRPDGLDEALVNASEFQREILADGEVTYQEYERSVFGTVACLKAAGVRIVVEPQPVPRNRLEYAWESSHGSSVAFDRCYQEHQDLVDILWTMQNTPSEQELIEARSALASCLRDAGVNLPERPSSSDFHRVATEQPGQFATCQQSVTSEFDLAPSWGG